MLRGLTTVTFYADDMEAAKNWYAELFGVEAYFVRPLPPAAPAYIEFRVGDYQHELGILDRRYAPAGSVTEPGGAVVYWHVDDLTAAWERLLSMGAKPYEEPRTLEAGFVIASVVDPFGNVLGIMYNPHYLEILAATKGQRSHQE